MLKFCPRHAVGYQSDFDPVCPQCTLAGLEAPATWAIDPATGDVKIPSTAADKTPINTRTRK